MGKQSSFLEGVVVDIYRDSKVFITGHTGIKGSWLMMMLLKLGANVIGYSDRTYLHYDTLIANHILCEDDYYKCVGDILDKDTLAYEIKKHNPDIVFHLAAQSIVSDGHDYPVNTFETNVMGTLNVLEACRSSSTRALVCITTDKVYSNKEWVWGYRESDTLWGSDPYSASKVCAEQVIDSYRKSYFNKSDTTLLASARAGNVIGGGECRKNRLVTDIMKAHEDNSILVLCNPTAKRPFQHVLDCSFGYLSLVAELLRGNREFADSWNFCSGSSISVKDFVEGVNKHIPVTYTVQSRDMIEANTLCLDNTKAIEKLNYKPIYSIEESIEKTCSWFIEYYENNRIITVEQIDEYYEEIRTNKK